MINKYNLDIILYFLMNINNVRTTAIASIINTLIFVATVDGAGTCQPRGNERRPQWRSAPSKGTHFIWAMGRYCMAGRGPLRTGARTVLPRLIGE